MYPLMNRRNLLGWIAATSLTLGGFAWAGPLWPLRQESPKVQWFQDLKAAHKAAVQNDKLILIVFGGPGCVYCTKLDKETLQNNEVAGQIQKDFVAVHLDIVKDKRIAEVLEVEALPTTIILNNKVDLLHRSVGFVKAGEFRKSLSEAVDREATIRQASGRR